MHISSTGPAVVIEFERAGEVHKTVRWCSDPTIFDALKDAGSLKRVKEDYAKVGATILRIYKCESMEIDVCDHECCAPVS